VGLALWRLAARRRQGYGALIEGDNQANLEGRETTLGDRAKSAYDLGTDPISLLALPALSVARRG